MTPSAPSVSSMPSLPDVGEASVFTYEQVAARVQQIRDVLAKRNVRMRSGSALDQLLRRAEGLNQKWENGTIPELLAKLDDSVGKERDAFVQSLAQHYRMAADALHVNRLTSAVLTVQDDPSVQQPLQRMASGIMQPDNRKPSQAKDALWEIVLLAHLRDCGLAAKFQDPPDIVMALDGREYPVACKKVWSEEGVEDHIRKGGKQLRPFENGGVIALNLDDIVPTDSLLCLSNRAAAGQFLDRFNLAFIERHRDLFEQAVMEGRCDGLWISVAAATVLTNDNPSFSLYTHASIWHLKDASAESIARLERFAAIVDGVAR
ncbi:hypothetical protein [Bordetella bronchiseptica]|uniref:hypothetical protein n=1 Tax=Bordetella bronchiseptica TaxID=518 RepID=UPI0012687217|nr:hypothetical protein [Bordetella bronchiseptica]